MNKTELVNTLAQRTGLTKVDAADIASELFQIISDTLEAGDKVRIDGFGTFEVRDRAPRVGRNPRRNVQVDIPARKLPGFTAHNALKEAVSRGG